MVCPICRNGRPAAGFTSVKLERGEFRLTIERVPGFICPSCGEAYLDEGVTLRLLAEANEMAEEGMIEGSRNFSS
jgi:YgiT-type zinc finger domain-containing protein